MVLPSRVGIVSFVQTAHGEHPGARPEDLLYEVCSAALAAAGLGRDDVDLLVSASDDVADGRSISNVFCLEAMGGFLREEAKVEEDGAWALFYAWVRLLAGPNEVALVAAHGKSTECDRSAVTGMMADPFFARPAGLCGLTAAALQASCWLRARRLSPEAIYDAAAGELARAARNPKAHRRRAMDAAGVAASPMLASPLTEAAVSPASDGAAAMVLAVEARAPALVSRPAWILGAGMSQDEYDLGGRDLSRIASAEQAAARAYRAAGVSDPRTELDFAELQAPFAHQLPMLREALGLDGGAFRVDPSGGALGADPGAATGLVRAGEAFLQLTGAAGPHQVAPRPRRALVHAGDGPALQSNLVFVLEAGS